MAIRIWGDGRPVVLVHGGFGSWLHWIRNIEALARSYRVIVPDLPGCGDSKFDRDTITMFGMAELLRAGLSALDVGNFDLVAFSFGCSVSTCACTMGPDFAERLIIVGSGGISPPRSRPDLVSVRNKESAKAVEDAHRENLKRLMFHDADKIDDLAMSVQARNVSKFTLNARQISFPGILNLMLPRVRVPLDGIWGSNDVTAGNHMDVRKTLIQGTDPSAEFSEIPDAGHWVQFEAHEAFNETLLTLLTRKRTR